MTAQALTTQRLINQNISGGRPATPLDIVLSMGAMQAQDYHGSLWALGLRTGLTQDEVIQAMEGREIIRTWPQRGTLHLVPAKDAKWLVGLSAERMLKGATRRREQLGLDDHTLARAEQLLGDALKGGATLTRPEILATLEAAGISAKGGRGYHILWYLAQTGRTYVGPMRNKQQTFGLLDDLKPAPVPARAEAIVELARRYFTSHGPATLPDFRWWAGLTAADARTGLAANSQVLAAETIDGTEYWGPKKIPAGRDVDEAFLLPGFDEYMLGYKDRSAALPGEFANKIVPGGNGMFLPTIVIRGQVVGTWKRTIRKDHVQLEYLPFAPLSAADKQLLHKPAEDYGRFLRLPTKNSA